MWKVVTRLLLAGWFIGMIGVAVWNGRGAEAQGGGSERLYIPFVDNADLSFHDYIGIVEVPKENGRVDFYTIRGDGSEWALLLPNMFPYTPNPGAWSPEGLHFAYVNGYETQFESLVLVSLEKRQPLTIFNGAVHGDVRWSPDGRYFAFSANILEDYGLRVYDTQTGNFTIFPYERYAFATIQWSPDSQMLTWVEQGLDADEQDKVYVWRVGTDVPFKVYSGSVMDGAAVAWSQDGTHLLFTADTPENGFGIYVASITGGDAEVAVEHHIGYGWMDGGAKLLALNPADDNFYLATPDSGDLAFFARKRVFFNVISPDGNYLLQGEGDNPNLTELVSINGTVTGIDSCRGLEFEWQSNSERFLCDSNSVYGFFGTTVGDVRTEPPTINSLYRFRQPRFVPNSTTHLAVEKYVPFYPPILEGSYLFNLEAGSSKRIWTPINSPYYKIEWRYLP